MYPVLGPANCILINNAGCELNKPLTETTVDDFASVYDLNVRTPFLLTQAVIPHLPKNGDGRIINISSVGSRSGFANLSLYCSSKAALEGLTRCCAAELGSQGHTVNAVAPGPVQSEMLDNIPREIVEMRKRTTPVQNRLGSMDDVARLWGGRRRRGVGGLVSRLFRLVGGGLCIESWARNSGAMDEITDES